MTSPEVPGQPWGFCCSRPLGSLSLDGAPITADPWHQTCHGALWVGGLGLEGGPLGNQQGPVRSRGPLEMLLTLVL